MLAHAPICKLRKNILFLQFRVRLHVLFMHAFFHSTVQYIFEEFILVCSTNISSSKITKPYCKCTCMWVVYVNTAKKSCFPCRTWQIANGFNRRMHIIWSFAGQIKSFHGPNLARGPYILHAWTRPCIWKVKFCVAVKRCWVFLLVAWDFFAQYDGETSKLTKIILYLI